MLQILMQELATALRIPTSRLRYIEADYVSTATPVQFRATLRLEDTQRSAAGLEPTALQLASDISDTVLQWSSWSTFRRFPMHMSWSSWSWLWLGYR